MIEYKSTFSFYIKEKDTEKRKTIIQDMDFRSIHFLCGALKAALDENSSFSKHHKTKFRNDLYKIKDFVIPIITPTAISKKEALAKRKILIDHENIFYPTFKKIFHKMYIK